MTRERSPFRGRLQALGCASWLACAACGADADDGGEQRLPELSAQLGVGTAIEPESDEGRSFLPTTPGDPTPSVVWREAFPPRIGTPQPDDPGASLRVYTKWQDVCRELPLQIHHGTNGTSLVTGVRKFAVQLGASETSTSKTCNLQVRFRTNEPARIQALTGSYASYADLDHGVRLKLTVSFGFARGRDEPVTAEVLLDGPQHESQHLDLFVRPGATPFCMSKTDCVYPMRHYTHCGTDHELLLSVRVEMQRDADAGEGTAPAPSYFVLDDVQQNNLPALPNLVYVHRCERPDDGTR